MLLRTLSALTLTAAMCLSAVAGASPRSAGVTPVTHVQKTKSSRVAKHHVVVSKRRQPREGRPLIYRTKRHIHVVAPSHRLQVRNLGARK